MSDVRRLAASEDDWWKDPEPEEGAPRPYDEYQACLDAADVQGSVNMIVQAVNDVDRGLLDGARWMVDNGEAGRLLAIAVTLQETRRQVAQIEALIARRVGRSDMAENEGELPDGRTYKVRRGATRKAWEHDEWKRDVRREILSGIGLDDVYDQNTGEHVDLVALLAAAQDVHGSADPKVKALKALGLDAKDYCEVVPGTWTIQVSAPATAPAEP